MTQSLHNAKILPLHVNLWGPTSRYNLQERSKDSAAEIRDSRKKTVSKA